MTRTPTTWNSYLNQLTDTKNHSLLSEKWIPSLQVSYWVLKIPDESGNHLNLLLLKRESLDPGCLILFWITEKFKFSTKKKVSWQKTKQNCQLIWFQFLRRYIGDSIQSFFESRTGYDVIVKKGQFSCWYLHFCLQSRSSTTERVDRRHAAKEKSLWLDYRDYDLKFRVSLNTFQLPDFKKEFTLLESRVNPGVFPGFIKDSRRIKIHQATN